MRGVEWSGVERLPSCVGAKGAKGANVIATATGELLWGEAYREERAASTCPCLLAQEIQPSPPRGPGW